MQDSLFGSVIRLLRRRWYTVVVVLAAGAILARVLAGANDYVSTEILHLATIEDTGLALGLDKVPELSGKAIAPQANADFKLSDLSKELDATFSWDDASRSVTISATGSSFGRIAAGAASLEKQIRSAIVDPVTGSLDVAIADLQKQIDTFNASIASIQGTAQSLDANDPTRAVLLATAADLRTAATKATNRRGSLQALRESIPSAVTTQGIDIVSSGAGLTTYAAGVIAAGALFAIGCCAWVLGDRRIRRRADIERSAPGIRGLGIVSEGSGGASIDPVVVASIRAFARDSDVKSIVIFGVPAVGDDQQTLADALQEASGIPVAASDQDAAGAVRGELSDDVGYLVVVRWGKTTEWQLSSSIADVRSVGNVPVAVLLVGVPERERTWAGTGSGTDGSPVGIN